MAWAVVGATNAAFDRVKAAEAAGQDAEMASAQHQFEQLLQLGAPAAELIAEGLVTKDAKAVAAQADVGAVPKTMPAAMAVVCLSAEAIVAAEDTVAAAEDLKLRAQLLFGDAAVYSNVAVDVQSLGPDQEQQRQAQELDQPVGEVLKEVYGNKPLIVARTSNHLRRENLVTLRDVLVAGRAKVSDIPNLGSGSMEALEEVFYKVNPGLVWHDAPTIKDIAKLCESLDQVTVRALADKVARVLRGMDMQTLASADIETLMAYVDEYDMGGGVMVKKLGRDKVAELQQAGRKFAHEFMAARAAIGQDATNV